MGKLLFIFFLLYCQTVVAQRFDIVESGDNPRMMRVYIDSRQGELRFDYCETTPQDCEDLGRTGRHDLGLDMFLSYGVAAATIPAVSFFSYVLYRKIPPYRGGQTWPRQSADPLKAPPIHPEGGRCAHIVGHILSHPGQFVLDLFPLVLSLIIFDSPLVDFERGQVLRRLLYEQEREGPVVLEVKYFDELKRRIENVLYKI